MKKDSSKALIIRTVPEIFHCKIVIVTVYGVGEHFLSRSRHAFPLLILKATFSAQQTEHFYIVFSLIEGITSRSSSPEKGRALEHCIVWKPLCRFKAVQGGR